MAPSKQVKINVLEFIEDPHDSAAYAIRFEILGPGTEYRAIRVSFTEAFMETFFKIRWSQKIAEKEHEMIKTRKGDFLLWALVKIEQTLLRGDSSKTVLEMDEGEDVILARKITAKKIIPRSQPLDERTFAFPEELCKKTS